jgi:hypothetical protein
MLKNVKWWLIFWLTTLLTLAVWWLVYTALSPEWHEPTEVISWNTLSSEKWNDMWDSIKYLKEQNEELEWKINTLSWKLSIIRKGSDITNNWTFYFLPNDSWSILYSNTITLTKWVYLGYFENRFSYVDNVSWLYAIETMAEVYWEGSISSSRIVRQTLQMINRSEHSIVIKVISDTADVRVVSRIYKGGKIEWNMVNIDSNLRYIQISE